MAACVGLAAALSLSGGRATAARPSADELPRVVRVSVRDAPTSGGAAPDLLTSCATRSCKGSFHPSVSDDGLRVAFTSDAEEVVGGKRTPRGFKQVYLRDLRCEGAARTVLVSQGYRSGMPGVGSSDFASISGDGSVVAFSSRANDLVPRDTGQEDVFVSTLSVEPELCGVLERISERPDGRTADGPSSHATLSRDGRWVAYLTRARDLDLVGPPGLRPTGSIDQLIVADRWRPALQRQLWISVGVGARGRPAEADGDCGRASLSDQTPPRVAFHSSAARLARRVGGPPAGDPGPGDDVFVHDLASGLTVAVSVSWSGEPTDGPSRFPSISGDGRWVAFESRAGNLTEERDVNGESDVYVRDLWTGTTRCVSVAVSRSGRSIRTQAGPSFAPLVSADGRIVVFTSGAPLLLALAGAGPFQLFAHDRDADEDGRYDEEEPGARRTVPLVRAWNGGAPDQWCGGRPMGLSRDGRVFAFMSEASNLVPADRNGGPELNPDRCCRRRHLASRAASPLEFAHCLPVDEEAPCEWGRDVFLGRIPR